MQAADGIKKEDVFHNSNLFSNHYLESMIQRSAEWGDESGLALAYARIRDKFFEKEKNLPRYVEAELEHNWIRPVLDALGHHYGVQESLHHDPLKPDYAFFPDPEALNEAYTHKGQVDFYRSSVVVGDAKAWSIALDKSRQGRALRDMANPSFQIDNYLRATPPKWAILTNGRLWRLYHEDSSFAMDSYYEVDLPHLIARIEATGDLSAFKYFYLFFRREAFPETPLGPSFLDRIREESLAYAQKVGEDLQENVYRAMKVLAEGFISEPSNSLSNSLLSMADPVEGERMLKEVQDNSMRLLYRLLFIFYAESRKLLAVDNPHYREMSLRRLKEEIAGKKDRGERILAVQSTYWESLRDLFRLINDGSEAFGYPKEEFYIPAYNGGLFDPAKNSFLAEKRIGNSYLAEAIDLLARSQGEGGPAFVDYSSLDIRHLGSIYEGILEYRLNIATESMVAVKEKSKKGKEVWLPKIEAGSKKVSDSVETGGLYLVTDKGERKATGSFYTPQYIVKYIVKNTLGPLIDSMIEEAMMDADLRRGLLRKLLEIKVLDPAMGSGHFLVEATDYIAREIIHAREIARQEEEDSDAVAENDIHWARREVVRNCIYGVDLNPMAVELAKLSLWLKTVASNKPLSFLDHHLRCGNSLIGAELEKLTVLPGTKAEEPPLWSFGLKSHTDSLLHRYSLMSALPDDSLQMVKWKEEQFRQIKESELSRRLAELANVWLSTFFGNKVSEDEYYELQGHLSPEKFPDWAGLREREWFGRAQEIAEEKRFFHWELEFPEAFLGEERGFDVVIGNPPYVSAWSMYDNEKGIRSAIMQVSKPGGILGAHWDLYIPFMLAAYQLMTKNGRFSFIIPNPFCREKYATTVRRFLLENARLERILSFGKENVFDEVSRQTLVIVFLKNEIIIKDESIKTIIDNIIEVIGNSDAPYKINFDKPRFLPQKLFLDLPGFQIRHESDFKKFLMLDKIDDVSIKMGSICYVNYGAQVSSKEKGSFGKHDMISGLPQGNSKKFFEGKNLSRYELRWTGFYLNYQPNLIYGPRSPQLFESNKLIIRHISGENDSLVASYDDTGLYCDHGLILAVYYDSIEHTNLMSNFDGFELSPQAKLYNLKYMLALLASKVESYYYALRFATGSLQGSYSHVYPQHVRNFPIRRISFTTPAPERARLVAELQQLYSEGRHDEILAQVQSLLPKDDAGNFISEQEKSDVVHDLLAFLAERMLEMNKQKQQEIRGFLDWLEGYLGAKTEDLKPKTRILSYYESDYESLLALLKKNKKRLTIDPSRREPAELLRAEFEGSVKKLSPLMERIRRTDELIDALVYRLYGLTDEEIRIVEGREAANAAESEER